VLALVMSLHQKYDTFDGKQLAAIYTVVAKLVVTQPVKKNPLILYKLEVYYCVY
jgi:hypothetical protein